jgi:hypothetical protein
VAVPDETALIEAGGRSPLAEGTQTRGGLLQYSSARHWTAQRRSRSRTKRKPASTTNGSDQERFRQLEVRDSS